MEETSLTQKIRDRLAASGEKKYAEFSGALVPGHAEMLGVRIPAIRALAKELRRDGVVYRAPDSAYFEELMLQGVLAGSWRDYDRWESEIRLFLPRVGDWSLCDAAVASSKTIAAHRGSAWEFLSECVKSDRVFTVRFGVVALMSYFLTEDTAERALNLAVGAASDDYYVRMAVAWCFATAAAKVPSIALNVLRVRGVDAETAKMLKSKARQSFRVSDAVLAELEQVLQTVPAKREGAEAEEEGTAR